MEFSRLLRKPRKRNGAAFSPGAPSKRASMGKRRKDGAQPKKRREPEAFDVSEPCGVHSDEVAGMAGLEPTNARVKVWCLTTWRHPNIRQTG